MKIKIKKDKFSGEKYLVFKSNMVDGHLFKDGSGYYYPKNKYYSAGIESREDADIRTWIKDLEIEVEAKQKLLVQLKQLQIIVIN